VDSILFVLPDLASVKIPTVALKHVFEVLSLSYGILKGQTLLLPVIFVDLFVTFSL